MVICASVVLGSLVSSVVRDSVVCIVVISDSDVYGSVIGVVRYHVSVQ